MQYEFFPLSFWRAVASQAGHACLGGFFAIIEILGLLRARFQLSPSHQLQPPATTAELTSLSDGFPRRPANVRTTPNQRSAMTTQRTGSDGFGIVRGNWGRMS